MKPHFVCALCGSVLPTDQMEQHYHYNKQVMPYEHWKSVLSLPRHTQVDLDRAGLKECKV